jgi:HK97 family phage portal protein
LKHKTKARPAAGTRVKEPKWQPLDHNVAYTDGVPIPEPFTNFLDAYGAHVWVYSCLRVIMQNLASVPILPYLPKKTKNGTEWIVDEKHELYPLLLKPNAYMSGYALRAYTGVSLKLCGNAYWYLEDFGTNEFMELWPLIPDKVQPVTTKERMIDHYKYTVNGTKVTIPYENMIQFSEVNPVSLIFGQGAMGPIRTTVLADILAQNWNKNFFKNGARVDAVLQTDKSLTPPVRTRVLESWRQAHSGAQNAHKIALLEGGLKYEAQGASNAKDMDFVNMRKVMREEVLAAFGVPPSVVGLLEFANYSNMDQQKKTFWMETLLPILRNMEEALTLRAEQITFRTETVFQADTSKVEALRPDMKMQADTLKTFVDSGVPINSVIEAMDLPFDPVEGGDKPRAPQPAGFGAPGQEPAEQPEKKHIPIIKGLENKDEAEKKRHQRWKGFDDRMRKWEGRIQIMSKSFFKGQRLRVLAAVDANKAALLNSKDVVSTIKEKDSAGDRLWKVKTARDSVQIIFDLQAETDKMKAPAERVVKGTFYDFAIAMGKRVGGSEFDFNLQDPRAIQYINDKVLKLSTEVNRTTLESLSDEIVDSIQEAVVAGYSEAETIAQIKERIDSVYEFANGSRSESIAITETGSAANAGNMQAMEQAGVDKKEWLSSRDDRVRETHADMDGQVVGIKEKFQSPSGAVLLFPGDPSAPADEVIRCRCVADKPE